MTDGYPGVLNFWSHEAIRGAMQTEQDLRKEAGNAQALRDLKIDQLLSGLQEAQCTLAARCALFPRLESEKWATFRDLLLIDQSDSDVYALIDIKVLNDESFPTYGHDTRHAAAGRWFIERKRRCRRDSHAHDLSGHAGRQIVVARCALIGGATAGLLGELTRHVLV
jgi:hypothetical protein